MVLQHTKFDGIVAGQQREHANDSSQTRTLPVGNDAHRYARGIHAQIRGSALLSVSRYSVDIRCRVRTITLLCVAESWSLSANWGAHAE